MTEHYCHHIMKKMVEGVEVVEVVEVHDRMLFVWLGRPGNSQSDLVLASILRVVMAVMASQPQTGAADSDSGLTSAGERKTLHLSPLTGSSKQTVEFVNWSPANFCKL